MTTRTLAVLACRRDRVLLVGAGALALVLALASCSGPSTGGAGPSGPGSPSATSVQPEPSATVVAPTTAASTPPQDDGSPVPDGAQTPQDSRRVVSVVVTYAGWDPSRSLVVAGAYVDGVIEAAGTCRLVLSGPDGDIEATGTATPDATTTSCGELAVAAPSGAFTATVSYSSDTARGESDATAVQVP